MADSKLFQAAAFYRDRGLSILPCRLFFDEKKKCKKPPLIKEWLSLQKKQVSMLEFHKWKSLLKDKPGVGLGIITGKVSNLIVVDIDSQESFDAIKPLLVGVHTVTVKTPNGWHYYFKYRDGFGNNVGIDPSSGLDIRAEGGYVLAPPSLYPDGRPYQFFAGGKFVDSSSVSPMPEILFNHMQKLLIEKKGKRGGARVGAGREKVGGWFHKMMLEGVPRGGRTAAMVEAEGYMLGRKIPREMIETFITMFNSSLGEDGLNDRELREEVIPAIDRIAGDIEEKTVERLNRKMSLVELDSGERVISEKFTDYRGIKKIRFAKTMQVRESYINKTILINKKPESIFDIWRSSTDRREHKGVIFDPSAKPWEEGDFINLWKGFRLEPKKADWSLFREHISTIISKEHHEWILQWMARIVQNPGGKRPGTVIVLRGPQGTGKGMFANIFGSLIGPMEYYFSVNKIGDLTGKFNEDLKTALLLFIDEATWGGDKETAGVLKSLVTEPTRRIEPKGINAFHVENYLNLIIASNNKWVVPGGGNERRFLVLDIPDDKQQDKAYFGKLLEQMYSKGKAGDEGYDGEDSLGIRGMFYDLLRMKVDHELIATIPKTSATSDQIMYGLDTDDEFWFERLSKGTLVDSHKYWKNVVTNEKLYSQYEEFCDSRRVHRGRAGRQLFGSFLKKVCPRMDRKQGSFEGERYWCRVFPDLFSCRQVFEKQFGIKHEWPDILEPDNIDDKMRFVDQPGPHYAQRME